jgi:uncharacterized protein (DUF1330 family)
MIYALNLFNLIPGKEDVYRDYSVKAGQLIYGLGGRVVCSGHQPALHLKTDGIKRNQFIVVEFPSENAFDRFYTPTENQAIHQLREASTRDYIWTLFNAWDLREWIRD